MGGGGGWYELKMQAMIYNIVAKLISDPEWQQKEKVH